METAKQIRKTVDDMTANELMILVDAIPAITLSPACRDGVLNYFKKIRGENPAPNPYRPGYSDNEAFYYGEIIGKQMYRYFQLNGE